MTAALLSGCKWTLLDPKGQIGVEERSIIITSTLLMLIVVIPVILMTIFFAWKYRASNKSADYDPNWSHSTKIELVVWAVPCLIILALGTLTWTSTHALDPYKTIESAEKPVTIQAVSLDWKWLFIYPDKGVATVNELAMPVGVPVNFEITSDSVMNAFFIPALGSQVYSMAGMTTKVSLIADHAGSYDGISSNYSGDGFSDMKFVAHAMSPEDYQKWLDKAAQSPQALDDAAFKALAVPSKRVPVAYYSNVTPGFFNQLVMKWMAMPMDHAMHTSMNAPANGATIDHSKMDHSMHMQMTGAPAQVAQE